ncbi:Hypothetical Protein FCC1311_023452 [Hondaea fermentalgiana]|uniref:Uncharacterized protein n=1 Tax=Hondaea fermentalgiana TaxID=2315210 RepID=A0A2R5G6H3_9STRA|nr:Hypothetical Protein FCC1311_023452 [Hondaea fermentalgiana]|eukprot:GBG26125.1 Hypothetical Protein FCC1311_023452 [Hondaea fermentalgiana]
MAQHASGMARELRLETTTTTTTLAQEQEQQREEQTPRGGGKGEERGARESEGEETSPASPVRDVEGARKKRLDMDAVERRSFSLARVSECGAAARAALAEDQDDGNLSEGSLRRYAVCLKEFEGEKALLPCRERIREDPYVVDRVSPDLGFAVLVGKTGAPCAGDIRRVSLGVLMRGVERAYWRSWSPNHADGVFCPAPFRRLARAMLRKTSHEGLTRQPSLARSEPGERWAYGGSGGWDSEDETDLFHKREGKEKKTKLERRPVCADFETHTKSPTKKRRTSASGDLAAALRGAGMCSSQEETCIRDVMETKETEAGLRRLFWADFCMDLKSPWPAESSDEDISEDGSAKKAKASEGPETDDASVANDDCGEKDDHENCKDSDESVYSSVTRSVDFLETTRSIQVEVLTRSSQKLSMELINLQTVEDVDIDVQWDSCESADPDVFDIFLADETDSQKLNRYVRCGGRCAEANDYIASRAEEIREHLRLRESVKRLDLASRADARKAITSLESFGRWLGMEAAFGIRITSRADSDAALYRERSLHLGYKLRHNAERNGPAFRAMAQRLAQEVLDV